MELNRAMISHPNQPSVEIDITKPDYQDKINAANDSFRVAKAAAKERVILREKGKPDIVGTESEVQAALAAREAAEKGK